MIVIGIDPGLTGAIAKIGHRGEFLMMGDMPVMQRGGDQAKVMNQVNQPALADMLREMEMTHDRNEIMVVIEKVQSMPAVVRTPGRGEGFKIAQGGASIFSFGHTAGCIETVVAVLGFRMELVRPSEWKKEMKLKSDKEQVRAEAIRAFPTAPLSRLKDHNRAEALMLARYGYQKYH